MKIAVEGCAHGELEIIYDTIKHLEEENNVKVDLLICCGDFQSTRNVDDMRCMAVPAKFRNICTFYKYYSGEKIAPVLTLFIGGNHEASNYLQELPYGGWVAPNIYYLGYSGVVDVAGVRIAGLSGIFKGWDYHRGRYEKPPYNGETLRSCYHIRSLDVFRLKQLTLPVHIVLSHDWPAGVYNHGNVQQLIRNKPFFKKEIQDDSLGNKPGAELLECLKPDYWFAAHLHVKFAAVVQHKDDGDEKSTKFLALDKCLPRRKFLQLVDVPHVPNKNIELHYDLEWLTILQLTNHLISVKKVNSYMPGPNSNERWKFTPTEEEKELVLKRFRNDLKIPENFVQTAPAYDPTAANQVESPIQVKQNPQTVEFCERLGIDDPMTLLVNEDGFNNSDSSFNLSTFESSSFIASTDSEADPCSPMNPPPPRSRDSIRTPLKLPKPSFGNSNNEGFTLTSTPCEKAESKLEEALPIPDIKPPSPSALPVPVFDRSDLKGDDADELPSAPGPKKFRRRNIALYTSNDEE